MCKESCEIWYNKIVQIYENDVQKFEEFLIVKNKFKFIVININKEKLINS